MAFSSASLRAQLMQLPVPQRYCVAYSGGMDSHVLLHALVQLRSALPCPNLHAIHINHGLHPHAGQWALHCEAVCRALDVSFDVFTVNVQRQPGQSLEALAREARYTVFANCVQANDMLVLAQHQGDQAETLLLQLLRGSGVKGLAAMPVYSAFAQGWMARPLLGHGRAELHEYAMTNRLRWVDDPSNQDAAYDRNFLRHAVLPVARQRWPALDATLARVAQHQAEAADLLDALAQQDLRHITTPELFVLNVDTLMQLEPMRQRNVLRYWLHRICALPLPSTVQLQRILDEVLPAAEDATPLVHWPGAEVRRYRNALHAMSPLQVVERDWQQQWDLQTCLHLPSGGYLQVQPGQGVGLRKADVEQGVTIRYRHGGERCRLSGRAHHHELKKLLQEWGVPPWQRDGIPLIFIGDQLAQVVGFCVCEPFMAKPCELGLQIISKPREPAIETMLENKDNSPGCTH